MCIRDRLFNVHKDCWSFSRRELSKREHICWPHVIYVATILEHLKTTNHAFLVLFQTYTDRSYSFAAVLICFCALLATFTEHVKHSVPLTLCIIKGADSRTWMFSCSLRNVVSDGLRNDVLSYCMRWWIHPETILTEIGWQRWREMESRVPSWMRYQISDTNGVTV